MQYDVANLHNTRSAAHSNNTLPEIDAPRSETVSWNFSRPAVLRPIPYQPTCDKLHCDFCFALHEQFKPHCKHRTDIEHPVTPIMVSFSCEVSWSTRPETTPTQFPRRCRSNGDVGLRRRSHEEETGPAPQPMLRCVVHLSRLHGTLPRDGISLPHCMYSARDLPNLYLTPFAELHQRSAEVSGCPLSTREREEEARHLYGRDIA